MSRQIHLDAPNLGQLEKKYIARAIDEGYVSTAGPWVIEFEDRIAAYLGIKEAVSTQSGTAAIHISLHELGIGPGDEVIVPALTFIATVNPIIYVGARPVFVDVDIETWNIDPEEIESNITPKTKAIIPVHFYGNPCNMQPIVDIAKKHNLYLIEDATESLGAKYKGKYVGSFGDLGCFSFNGNKVITTGGGGMVVGPDKDRLEHIKFLVNQARDNSKGYYHPEVGFNYRMTNLEAALGLAQLEKLDEFLAKKRRFNQIYREQLKDCDFVQFQEPAAGAESIWWLTCIILRVDFDLDHLQKELKQKGIPTRRVFMPITESFPYKACKKGGYRNSYYIYDNGLCLPGSTLNSEDDIKEASQVIRELLKAGEVISK